MNQLEQLQLFNEKVDELADSSFTKSMLDPKSGITLSTVKGGPAKVERRGPSRESIKAFVLTYRFFIQDNEKTSLRNLSTLYEGLAVEQKLKDEFKRARDEINRYLDSDSMYREDIDGKPHKYTNREILDIFIYGGLAHANDQKLGKYRFWMSSAITCEVLTNEFTNALGTVLHALRFIGDLNSQVIAILK